MKKIILLFLMLSSLTITMAANRTITGYVYDSGDKQPLPGVMVRIQKSSSSTLTNSKGYFSITLPDGAVELQFAFLGYQMQTITVKKQDKLTVYLTASSQNLNEVAVVENKALYKQKDMSSPRIMLRGRVSGVAATQRMVAPVMGYHQAPQDQESYKGITENGFHNPKDSPLSTFSVDVDAASYSNVRRFINNGQLPPKDAVRTEEMINYFSYNLPPPTNGEPVAIHTELSAAPWNPQHRLLRIGLKARVVETNKLPASNLVFLIDVSGSMASPNKLPLVQSSLKMLVDQLRAKDKVAIVVYAGAAGLVLPSTPGDQKTTIKDAIDRLGAGGSTAGGEGIKLAYRTAKQNILKNGNNRVILATDGDFNVGASSDSDMEQLIEQERKSGIFLSVLGYGMGNYKDSKMEALADKGNGHYAYIDNITEARKTLVSEFGGTLFTVAKDVKLQLEFNPAKVASYRLIGYENRLLNKQDFNNDKKMPETWAQAIM